MIGIVGGKCDGQQSPVKTLTLQEGDEEYLLIGYREGAGAPLKHFFMLAGMTPIEALKIHKEREALREAFQALPK